MPYHPTYYFPAGDVHAELVPAAAPSTHPAGWRVSSTIVWIYRAPLPESQKIAGLACFYNEKVDIHLDGELQERPWTQFS